MAASVTLSAVQKVGALISPTDANGNHATVSGVLWAVDNPTIVSLTPSADGLTCDVAALAPGTATITVTAQNGVGATLTDTGAVTVTPDAATALNLSFGTPVLK